MTKLRLAYVISAYKLPENLSLLVEALVNSKATVGVIISVDKNTSTATFSEMKSLASLHKKVSILPREKSIYRSFGHVRSSLRGLGYLRSNNIDYDFVFLLTGQDYPIKSDEKIQAFLEKHKSSSFMEYFPLPTNNWKNGSLDRLNRYYIHTRRGVVSIDRKNIPFLKLKTIPNNLRPFGGSGYWTINKTHAEYILEYVNNNPTYVSFFNRTDIPDELFFQTILLNSSHAKKVINNNLRYIDWTRPGEYPAIIRSKDYSKLSRSKALLARKFDCSIDDKIITMISKGLL